LDIFSLLFHICNHLQSHWSAIALVNQAVMSLDHEVENVLFVATVLTTATVLITGGLCMLINAPFVAGFFIVVGAAIWCFMCTSLMLFVFMAEKILPKPGRT